MYNEQLEQLIDAALADGVLTEKEKQVLFKKAQTLGVDLDEFEMVLDARLVKLQKEQQSSAPKSNKLGDVKKCPACGAIVQSYQGVCKECGYAFENTDANSSAKKLAEMIKSAKSEEEVAKVIKSFPVPTNKADLLEFISTCSANAEESPGGVEMKAYMAKCKECVNKAKILFPNDKEFKAAIDIVNELEKKWKDEEKLALKILAVFIAVFFIGGFIVLLFE